MQNKLQRVQDEDQKMLMLFFFFLFHFFHVTLYLQVLLYSLDT